MTLLSESNRESNFALLLIVLVVITLSSACYAQSSTSDENTTQSSQSTTSDSAENPLTALSDGNNQQDKTQSAADNSNVEDEVFNIDVLIERMKDTQAIGVISKLSLKNKVDDLLEKAQSINTSDSETTDIAEDKMELREKFEGLILKTVTLLNKGEDFNLAQDIYQAREELWKSIMENKA